MTLSLRPDTQALILSRMGRGGYSSPDDLVQAALASLEQAERALTFRPGELDQLLAVGDREIEKGDLLDGIGVFDELRQRSGKVDRT